MEALFIFVAKSSGLLILFYLAYHFLLRKETFFNSNRWFLLIGLITSVALPFLVYTKVVWVDPTPLPNFNYSPTYVPQSSEKESFVIDWNLVSLAIYAIGFLAFMLKFALDFYNLNSVLKGLSGVLSDRFCTNTKTASCSEYLIWKAGPWANEPVINAKKNTTDKILCFIDGVI